MNVLACYQSVGRGRRGSISRRGVMKRARKLVVDYSDPTVL